MNELVRPPSTDLYPMMDQTRLAVGELASSLVNRVGIKLPEFTEEMLRTSQFLGLEFKSVQRRHFNNAAHEQDASLEGVFEGVTVAEAYLLNGGRYVKAPHVSPHYFGSAHMGERWVGVIASAFGPDGPSSRPMQISTLGNVSSMSTSLDIWGQALDERKTSSGLEPWQRQDIARRFMIGIGEACIVAQGLWLLHDVASDQAPLRQMHESWKQVAATARLAKAEQSKQARLSRSFTKGEVSALDGGNSE